MRTYILDELRRADMPRIKSYLNDQARPAGLDGIWWVELAKEQLSETQQAHRDCQPFCYAIEVGKDFVKFELLIRSRQTMRCGCISYATLEQRELILGFADRMVRELELKT